MAEKISSKTKKMTVSTSLVVSILAGLGSTVSKNVFVDICYTIDWKFFVVSILRSK